MNYDVGIVKRRRIIPPSHAFFSDTGGSAAYAPLGVRFDGTDTLLSKASGLTGAADAKVGMCSFWFKMKGNDAAFNAFLEAAGGTLGLSIYRWNDNKLRIVGTNAATTTILLMTSTTSYVNGMGWTHVMASWDLSIGRGQLYVNGADDRAGSPTLTDDTIDYTQTRWDIGARSTNTLNLNAEVADFYVNFATSLDLSSSTNRDKFYLAGEPVDPGADGSTPTGTAPIIFLGGAVSGWETNDGTGQGFTLAAGTLNASGDNP
jgi:hypothetical protein